MQRTNIILLILSGISLSLLILSPARDIIANLILIPGFSSLTILLIINLTLVYQEKIEYVGTLTIKLTQFFISILLVIGFLFGGFLAIWSPVWFIPFGYYLLISFTITFSLFVAISHLHKLYYSERRKETNDLIN